MSAPLVSVVVVSFNQGRFVGEAIGSVLAQDHDPLEVIVVDGGSTDGSGAVIEEFESRVRVIDGDGTTQAQAIARGMAAANGEVVSWLNSDDRQWPGAVRRAVAAFAAAPRAGLVYGEGIAIDAHGRALGRCVGPRPFDAWVLRNVQDYIVQPAAFVRAEAWRTVGGIDESLEYALDWDLWIRIAEQFDVVYLPEPLACSREHRTTKTARGGFGRWRELRAVLARHGVSATSPASVAYGLDTLRRRWPALFGAGSLSDREALRGRWLARAMMPVHWVVSWQIARQLARRPRSWPPEEQAERGTLE